MAFSKETKSSIDLILPAGAAAYMAYNLYTKGKGKKQWQQVLIPTAIVFAIVWLVTSRITKTILAKKETPGDLTGNYDTPTKVAGGGGDVSGAGFNPAPYTARLHSDLYEFGFNSHSLYTELNTLSNAQLQAIYNDWKDKHYHEESETLTAAIDDEWLPGSEMKVLMARLRAIGAN